jgi:hypothetical protein
VGRGEDEGKGFSILIQIEGCQKLAEREGCTMPKGHLCIDEGISGTTLDQPWLRTFRALVHTQGDRCGLIGITRKDALQPYVSTILSLLQRRQVAPVQTV